MRLLNILVIGALIVAASYVYKIKFDSTLQAERVAKLRTDLHRVRAGLLSCPHSARSAAVPSRTRCRSVRSFATRSACRVESNLIL